MDKSEFERLKAEEKAHLRQMRALKQQARDAQRTASTASALGAMRNPALEDETDALTRDLQRGAASAEARLEIAMEGQAPVTGPDSDVDRESLKKAEAEALVRQMKAEMGARDEPSTETAARASASDAAPASAKTIGRTPPPAADPPPVSRGGKTIGRSRDQ